MIEHIYFLIHPVHEPERYESVLKMIKKYNITNYTLFTHLWGCNITPEMRNKYVKTDTSMKYHNRTMDANPLSNGEISLFLNHIECLQIIKRTYTNGLFLVCESDAIFRDHFWENLSRVIELSKQYPDYDIINIGGGNGHDLPVSKPIQSELDLYKEKRNRAAEGIIWNYRGILNFLDYYEKTCDIDAPIDCKMDVYSEFIGGFNIYWAHPPLIFQGSVHGQFKSLLR